MHKHFLVPVALLFAGVASPIEAQESLLIGPGDQVHIQVFDTPEMDQHPRVTDAGEVPLMFIGNIKVGGLTPADAAHQIEEALKSKGYMLHPQVTLSVDAFATQDVTIMGQVHDPGTYDLSTPAPILKVLSLAGGLSDSANRTITIERRSNPGEKITYRLSNTSEDALGNQPVVYPGDIVFVPRAGVVYVLGDVAKPGGFAMADNESRITLLQALALAGIQNKTAQLGKAKLLRQSGSSIAEVPIKIAAIQKGESPDIALQPNDVLYIPSSWMKNMIFNNTSIASAATNAIIYHP